MVIVVLKHVKCNSLVWLDTNIQSTTDKKLPKMKRFSTAGTVRIYLGFRGNLDTFTLKLDKKYSFRQC